MNLEYLRPGKKDVNKDLESWSRASGTNTKRLPRQKQDHMSIKRIIIVMD